MNALSRHPEYRYSLLTLLLLLTAVWGFGDFPLPLTKMRIAATQEEIERVREELQTTVAANKSLADELTPYRTMRESAIRQSEEAGALRFRERIDEAVRDAEGMKIRNTGNIRQIEVADQVLLYEVSFAADGNTKAVVAFLNSLYRKRPRLYFRSLTIKPAVSGSSDAIAVNATLCALNFTVPEKAGPTTEVKP